MKIEKYKITANDKEALAFYLSMVEATADGTKTIVETTETMTDVDGETVTMDYYELVDYEAPVEEAPQLSYEELVASKIRQRYSQNDVEAILANYLNDQEKYREEFAEFQSYRESCKAEAKSELGL